MFRNSATGSSNRSVTVSPGKRPRQWLPLGKLRRRLPSRPWRWLIAGALGSCLITVGVVWAIWPSQPAPTPLHLVTGTVQADLLTPDQVSRLTGVTVVSGPQADQAPPAVAVTPSQCAAAAGPATQSVYGHGWTGFLSTTDEDAGGTGDYTVSQVVGVFPGSGAAEAAFKTLTSGLARCSSSVTTGQAGRTAKWTYSAYPPTLVAAAWSASQAGSGGWACYHQARLQGSALFEVAVCGAGDGQPAVSAIADAIGQKASA